jgi:hypothetical protein
MATGMLKKYLSKATLVLAGLGALYLAFTGSAPAIENLQQVRGSLDSFHFGMAPARFSGTRTIVVLQDGTRFWTRALTASEARAVFRREGLQVVTYRDPAERGTDFKAYGLWVEGSGRLQSAEEAASRNRLQLSRQLPLMGLLCFGVVLYGFRSRRRGRG